MSIAERQKSKEKIIVIRVIPIFFESKKGESRGGFGALTTD